MPTLTTVQEEQSGPGEGVDDGPPPDDLATRWLIHAVALLALIVCWAFAGGAVEGDPLLSTVLWGTASAAVIAHGVIRTLWPSPGWAGMWQRAPGITLTMFMVPATVALLASVSVPGGVAIVGFFALVALLVLGGVWVLRAATFGWSTVRRRQRGSWLPLLVAPIGCMFVVGLIVADVPFRARWAASTDAFADLAQRADRVLISDDPVSSSDGGDEPVNVLDIPGRVGAFQIEQAHSLDGGIVLYETTSGFLFSGGGFAHLPDGTTGVTFGERTSFEHLNGDWYAFTYSD